VGVNLLIFIAVMLFLLYGTKHLKHATPQNLEKLAKPALGVGAFIFAGVMMLRGHIEMGIALGGFGLYLLGYVNRHKWIDMFGGATQTPQQQQGSGGSDGGGAVMRTMMTPEEACRVLGVSQNATREEIASAHHRLMKKLHPDVGEPSNLVLQVNEARDVLLRGRG
jgi:hypothetical protein